MNLLKVLAATSRSRWRGGGLTSPFGRGEVMKQAARGSLPPGNADGMA